MARIIMPVFASFPAEGAIVGRLLSGYGDLEFDLCHCVAMAVNDLDMVLKAMYRPRGETQRILIADAIGRKPYRALNLETPFSEAVAGMQHCRKIRNQFSHCNWFADTTGALAFVDLQEIAQEHAIVQMTALTVQHVSLALLREQEEYFGYISDCLGFLNLEAQRLAGRLASHGLSMPPKMRQPLQRNP